MFDHKSDYALNKRSPNIVYRAADGSCLEIHPEECPDFDLWKALSDEDYHTRELLSRRIARYSLPLDESICGCVDEYDDGTQSQIVCALDQLTETQRRRCLLHFHDGLSTRQIAQMEGVSQHAIMTSLNESRRKIKKFSKMTSQKTPKNGDR